MRKERLFYGCLGKGHAIKDCKVHPCGIYGCTKKHNRLLHSENQLDEGSHTVNVSAATTNQSNQITSFLQIVPVSVQSGGKRLTTYSFLDSGSIVSFIDQSVKDQLQGKGTDVTLNIAGIHGTQDLRTEKVPILIKGLHSKVCSIEAFAHPSISLGNTTYDYKELKNNFRHLNVLTNKKFNLMEVSIIIGQDAYKIQRPLDYKIGTQSEPFAVLTDLGWVVSGPMTGKKSQNVCHFAFTEDVKVAKKYPIMVGHRNLCLQKKCCKSIKERATSSEVSREHYKVYRRAVRSGHALERTRNQSSKQLQLGPWSALLTGTKIPTRPKFTRIVSTIN